MFKVECKDASERLVAEQALGIYRALRATVASAEHGRGMEKLEEVTLDRGREHLRVMLERAVAEHDDTEKKGPNPLGVPGVVRAAKPAHPRGT